MLSRLDTIGAATAIQRPRPLTNRGARNRPSWMAVRSRYADQPTAGEGDLVVGPKPQPIPKRLTRQGDSKTGRLGCTMEATLSGAERGIDTMPYVQLDLPLVVPPANRIDIADALCGLYARIMGTTPDIVSIAFRELGDNGVLRPGPDGRPAPAIVVTCDIRVGRTAETRLQLAKAIADLLETTLAWPHGQVRVYFTQHPGEEIYRAGTFAPDWSATTTDSAP